MYIYIYIYVCICIYIYTHNAPAARIRPVSAAADAFLTGAPSPRLFDASTASCRVGGDTFTPERYRLELYSVHTFTRSRALDPHTQTWGSPKKTTHTQFRGWVVF